MPRGDEPLIELWNLDCFTGLIVPAKTGIFYTNQCGGTACTHPEIEGFYVPIQQCSPDDDPLLDIWVKRYEPDVVARFIAECFYPLDTHVAPLEEYIGQWGEAWVPVKVIRSMLGPQHAPELEALIGRTAIITYQNSD